MEIDGKSTEGVQLDEAVKRLKGEAGTKVTLDGSPSPARAEKETVTITREMIHVETVLGDRRKADDSWDFMLDHDKHIGYIRIDGLQPRHGRRTCRRRWSNCRRKGSRG